MRSQSAARVEDDTCAYPGEVPAYGAGEEYEARAELLFADQTTATVRFTE